MVFLVAATLIIIPFSSVFRAIDRALIDRFETLMIHREHSIDRTANTDSYRIAAFTDANNTHDEFLLHITRRSDESPFTTKGHGKSCFTYTKCDEKCELSRYNKYSYILSKL